MRYIEVEGRLEMISEYIERMIKRFKHLKEVHPNEEFQVKGEANGVTLYIDENSTVESVTKDYRIGLKKNAEEYLKTDEYKEKMKQREEENKRLQSEVDIKMEEFKKLDKSNLIVLLQWLADFQPYSDRISINFDKNLILNELKALGYTANMNCENEFNGKDKANFAGWIIGQCMDGLEKVGAIHGVVHRFVGDWNKEFSV